jgi:hypothetical protein
MSRVVELARCYHVDDQLSQVCGWSARVSPTAQPNLVSGVANPQHASLVRCPRRLGWPPELGSYLAKRSGADTEQNAT